MKILIINSTNENISTGQISRGLKNACKNLGHQTLSLFGRGVCNCDDEIRISTKFELALHVLLSRLTGLQGYFSFFSTKKAIRIIKQFKPDLVLVGNLHGYYLNFKAFVGYLKSHSIPTCLFMFDEYIFLGKCSFPDRCTRYETGCGKCPRVKFYPKSIIFDRSHKILADKIKAFSNHKALYINGFDNSVNKIKTSLFYKSVHPNLLNIGWGINYGDTFRILDKVMVRKELGLPVDSIIVLAVAPISFERKGIKQYFYNFAKRCHRSDVLFVHIGNDLNDKDYPNNLVSLPFVSDQNLLAKYFCSADYFALTSKDEGYPTTCIYSLLCGTPIFAFDSVFLGDDMPKECVRYFRYGDIDGVISFLEKDATFKNDAVSRKCRSFSETKFNMENVVLNIISRLGLEDE